MLAESVRNLSLVAGPVPILLNVSENFLLLGSVEYGIRWLARVLDRNEQVIICS